MFHPVGSQPPGVYWRRRLFFVGSAVIVLVLLAITVRAVAGGSSSPSARASSSVVADGTAAMHTASPTPTRHSAASTTATKGKPATTSSKSAKSSASGTGAASTVTATCRTSDLQIIARVAHSTYSVGQRPELEMQVTNTGSAPCVQDLAVQQVVLKIYNGESRVWDSHDCSNQPGTSKQVLAVNAPVVASMVWSGYTSEPRCAGQQQRVGAGTYTLYASLSGKTGTAAQFTIN